MISLFVCPSLFLNVKISSNHLVCIKKKKKTIKRFPVAEALMKVHKKELTNDLLMFLLYTSKCYKPVAFQAYSDFPHSNKYMININI